jgi:hypothetical protein
VFLEKGVYRVGCYEIWCLYGKLGAYQARCLWSKVLLTQVFFSKVFLHLGTKKAMQCLWSTAPRWTLSELMFILNIYHSRWDRKAIHTAEYSFKLKTLPENFDRILENSIIKYLFILVFDVGTKYTCKYKVLSRTPSKRQKENIVLISFKPLSNFPIVCE